MSKTVNKAIIIGYVAAEPKTVRFQNNGMISNFTLATNHVYLDKTTNKNVEQTEWHRIVTYGKLAEIAEKYLQKGMMLYVEGAIKYRKYDKNGTEVHVTEINASTLNILSSKNNNGNTTTTQTSNNIDDELPF